MKYRVKFQDFEQASHYLSQPRIYFLNQVELASFLLHLLLTQKAFQRLQALDALPPNISFSHSVFAQVAKTFTAQGIFDKRLLPDNKEYFPVYSLDPRLRELVEMKHPKARPLLVLAKQWEESVIPFLQPWINQ